jgi:uncharacterized protein
MMLFGEDFHAAFKTWLYPQEKQQNFWRAFGIFALLFVLYQIFQILIAYLIYVFGFKVPIATLLDPAQFQIAIFMRAALIAAFPAALPILLLTIYFTKFGLPNKQGSLPLNWPRLGFLGWCSLLIVFVVLMILSFNVVYWSTGMKDADSSGMVEKAMAELTKDPMLFALSLPSIILAAPLAEELLFRGFLFAGLVNTPVGKPGAVVLSSALWALAHAGAAPWVNVGLLFAMGIVLGVMLLRFGSLWVTIACHTAWNTLSSIIILAMGTHS